MSRFHVGQMVIVVGPPESDCMGRFTTVVRLGVEGKHHGRRFIGIQVDIPNPWFGSCVFMPEHLLPIDTGNPDVIETEEEVTA